MLTALIEFIHRLRNAAIPISMVEALDAAHALRHIDLGSRAELKAALAAVLVKRAEHRAPFAALFDVSSAPRRAEASRRAGAPATLSPPLPADLTEAAVGEGGSEDLLAALLEALRRNDAGALRAIAALAVQRFGGLDVQRDGSVQYYLYRVLRQLDLSNLMQRAMRDGGGTGADASAARGPLAAWRSSPPSGIRECPSRISICCAMSPARSRNSPSSPCRSSTR